DTPHRPGRPERGRRCRQRRRRLPLPPQAHPARGPDLRTAGRRRAAPTGDIGAGAPGAAADGQRQGPHRAALVGQPPGLRPPQPAWGPSRGALASTNSRPGRYDSHLRDALASGLAHLEDRAVQTVPIAELTSGMVLTADVLSHSGIRLVPGGHESTPSLLERI